MPDEDPRLLERIDAGFAAADGESRIVRWNENAERITGLTAEDVLGKPWNTFLESLGGNDRSAKELVEATLRSGRWTGIIRVRIRQKDLRIRAQVMGFRDSDTGKPGLAAIFWPAEAETEAPALPYREQFDQSPEALLLVDTEGLIVDASPASATLFGRERDRLVGTHLGDLATDWTDADRRAAIAEVKRAGAIMRTVQIRIGDPGDQLGETVTAEIVCTMASPSSGYLMLRIRDVFQTRERERVFRELSTLARLGDEPEDQVDTPKKAINLVTAAWRADAGLMLLYGDGDQGGDEAWRASDATPAEVLRTFVAQDVAGSAFSREVRAARRPFEVTISEAVASGRLGPETLGDFETMWVCPLWFADKIIGSSLLLWKAAPSGQVDANRLEQTSRFAGLAVGNAELRNTIVRDAESRSVLEDSARIGSVIVNQMPEGIVAIDARSAITAVNPAAERIYGFKAADALGRSIVEVIEQLQLDGSRFQTGFLRDLTTDHWQGRVINRPMIGRLKGQHVVVDLSLTSIKDSHGRKAGYIGMVRPVYSEARLDADAALLGSLAVALGRARGRREVAEASVETLSSATMADAVALVSWRDPDNRTVDASRGFSPAMVQLVGERRIPQLINARREPGVILSLEQVAELIHGHPSEAVVNAEEIKRGFIVDLRVRNEVVGSLLLGSRRDNWIRPPDEVILQVAAQIANALENARYLDEERRLNAQLEAMMSLMRLPEGEISETGVAQLLLERIGSALGADGGVVIRLDNGRFKVVAGYELPESMRKMLEGATGEHLYFWRRLLERGGTSFHESLDEMARKLPEVQAMARGGLKSQAVFPIRDGDALIGAFVCHFLAPNEPNLVLDERALDAIGRVISIAYANGRMSEGLADAAERERRLAAELRGLQGLTLLGASPDDLASLARETIDMVVIASGAAGGGYFLVEDSLDDARQICWVGQPSRRWATDHPSQIPADWPALSELNDGLGAWLSSDPCHGDCDYEAVLPLRIDDKLAGFLHLEWTTSPGDEEFDVDFLDPIARVCSISLANFRLRSELVHRAAEEHSLNLRLGTLDQLTQIGEQASTFEELAHRTVNAVKEVLGATGVCYLLMEQGHHFDTHAVAGETGAFRLWLKGVPARDAPGGKLLLSGSESVLEDFVAGQVHERVLPLARATGFASFGAIPIRTGEELAGALLCFFEEPVSRLSIDEASLDSVARIAGIALANYRLRDSLSSSEQRYRTLFAQTPDALFVSALDGTVLDANEAAVRTYRVNRGEMLGRYIGQLISADEREMARRRQIVWAQGRGTFRDRGRRHDGSEFPVAVEIRVVELDGQRRFLYLIRDMSDEERLTGELLQAQKMEAIGNLVSGVAHELNNPLTGIIAFSVMLKGDPRLPDDMRHDAQLLVQEADRTKRIVQNLLDFARARQPERRSTPLRALISSVLELQSYAIGANQIQVEVNIPDDVPPVDLDRAQFQQVFLNLTINAIQAMRGSSHHTTSHLWISAELLAPHGQAGRVERIMESQRIKIVVRDDGPGVPEANRPNLFVPFFTTKEPGEGTGLGLSVSFGIVSAHGGNLYYEPGPDGVGSMFIIEMPVKAAMSGEDHPTLSITETARPTADDSRATASDAAEPPASAGRTQVAKRKAAPGTGPDLDPGAEPANTPAHGPESAVAAALQPAPVGDASAETRKPQILILDDEYIIREVLRRTLKGAGMEPHLFQDGAQALDGVQQMLFDVMLIDHQMPNMSGTRFYELAVATRPELAKRAVFMSGYAINPELLDFAEERGIRLVQKPFDMEQLIATMRDTMRQAEEN